MRLQHLAIPLLCLIAAACTTQPPSAAQPAVPADPNAVPELTLNLPETVCDCPESAADDRDFFERGYAAVAAGEYVEAAQHFDRYRRMEESPVANWEGSIAIAYLSVLPNSPFFDPREARSIYHRIRSEQPELGELHEVAVLMRDSLELFDRMDVQVRDLSRNVDRLSTDLAKREAALQRLRELTLSQ